jgi:hypothetical protein
MNPPHILILRTTVGMFGPVAKWPNFRANSSKEAEKLALDKKNWAALVRICKRVLQQRG